MSEAWKEYSINYRGFKMQVHYIGYRGTSLYWGVKANSVADAKKRFCERMQIAMSSYIASYRNQPAGLPVDFI